MRRNGCIEQLVKDGECRPSSRQQSHEGSPYVVGQNQPMLIRTYCGLDLKSLDKQYGIKAEVQSGCRLKLSSNPLTR